MPTGTSGWRARKPAISVEAIGDLHPGIERALGRGLDHRPVGDRVGKGNADLDHVGAARDHRIEQFARWSRDRDRRASGTRRTRPRRCRAAARTSRRSGSCEGPAAAAPARRPCRRAPTSRRAGSPRAPARASLSAWASACADSNAHKMPSFSASRRNAASASASVAPTYCARPLSFRCACSGPTAG